jgi:transposase
MENYAGIDVSLNSSSVCVVDASGRVVREAKIASEPEALIAWFRGLGFAVARIGLEAGPLSQWLYAAMCEAGLAVELLETRHVRDAFKAMPVKTDRKDARYRRRPEVGARQSGCKSHCGQTWCQLPHTWHRCIEAASNRAGCLGRCGCS